MKDVWMKIKEWWNSLGSREKQYLRIGSVALAIFIVYQFIWNPMNNAANTLRSRIVSNEKTLLWMQNTDKQISKLASQNKENKNTLSPVLLLGVLQKQIDNAGLQQYLTQLKQMNNDAIEMHFQKVQFDELISLLIKATKEHGIVITQMTVTAEKAPGIVNADVYLR